REGMPKGLLEASACGKPIVATDVPGCRDAVRHGVSGLLVPPCDAAGLADAMGVLIGDAEMRSAMGQAARERALRELSEELVVQRTLDVYRGILADRWPEAGCFPRDLGR